MGWSALGVFVDGGKDGLVGVLLLAVSAKPEGSPCTSGMQITRMRQTRMRIT